MSKARKDLRERDDDYVANSDSLDDYDYRDVIFEYETELNMSLEADDKMDEHFIISDDEDYPLNSSNRTIRRPSGGNNLKQRVEKGVTEENESESDIIYIPSDSDSDSDLPVIWTDRSDHNQSYKHDDVSIDMPSTSNGSGYGKRHSAIKQESTSQQSKGKVIKDETNERRIKDSSSDEALEQEWEDGGESFDEGKSSSRRDQLAAMEYKSEDQAEEQTNGIGEEDDSEENQADHWTKRDESGNVDGEGNGNVTTLEELWRTDTQSYSQVEPAKNIVFENETWESLQSDLPGSSSVGAVPAPESPLPRGSPSSFTTDHEDHDAGSTVQSTCTCASGMDVLHCPDSQCPHYMYLLDQALQRKERLVIRKIPLPSDFNLESINSESGPERVYKRPKKNYTVAEKKRRRARPDSSDDSSSTDDELQSPLGQRKPDTLSSEQADAKRKGKAKQKTCKGRRGRKKRQKVAKGYKVHSVRKDGSRENSKTGQDSNNGNHLHQGQSGGQSGREDGCSLSLNEGTEEEPMDIGSDEDTHKLLRGLVGRKRPVVSESETDSDETCIEDNEESSSQACSIKSESLSPNATSAQVVSESETDSDETCIEDNEESSSQACSIKSESLSSNATSAQVGEEVSDCLQTSRVSADAVSPGRTTLTPRSKMEPIIGEEGTSTDDLRPFPHQAVNIKPDLPRSGKGSERKDERFRGNVPNKKLETIKGSKQSNGRNGKSTEGLLESGKSPSYSPTEVLSRGKTLKHRLIPVEKVSKIRNQKSKSLTTSAGEGLLTKDSHSQSKKVKQKTNREHYCSPDEINTGTFYGTSNGTKIGPISTERKRQSLSSTPARAESWDEILRNEREDQKHEDESPSPVLLAKEQQGVENKREEAAYPETMPFSPRENMFDKNNDSEDFYTQPFSPMLDDDSENLTSDVGNELGISQTTGPRDSPLHLTDDERHSEQESTTNYFPTDSQISCQNSDEEVPEDIINDADLATPSSHRSNDEIGINQQHTPTEDDSPLQYFPTDSQLSISLDSEDTEELATQNGKAKVTSDEEPQSALYIPTKSHSSRGVSEGPDENSGRKLLPCQRNAWSQSELDPQQRFLLLNEEDAEAMSFTQENEDMPSFPAEIQSTSTAVLGNHATKNNNEQKGAKKNKSFQRPSRTDILLTTIKQTDQQTKKNPTKKTRPVQDTPHSPSNPSDLSLGDPSEIPPAPSINSLQDRPKQAKSARFNEVAEDNAITTVPRSIASSLPSVPSSSHSSPSFYIANTSESLINHTDGPDSQLAGSAIFNEVAPENTVTTVPKSVVSSLPSVSSLSSPSPSFYLANISDSSINQTEGPDSHSGASQTSHNIQKTVKATADLGQDGPSGSTNPSSTASSIPLKKRPLKEKPHSQATKVPSGKQRTKPSEASQKVHHELKTEDILSCVLSWNTDWYIMKHKEVSSSEVLQSMCKELSRSCKSYSDVRSYQEAFSCFLLMEMWCKVSCSMAEDCPGTWKQNSMVNKLSQDVVEVQYESDENQAEAHEMIEGDLVLVDMSTINATQKQFQFGLVQCNGPSERTVCLALHKSTIVPSSTRMKVVTSLRHYLNQIRALLSFTTHPLAKHIIKPEESPVFAHETQDTQPVVDTAKIDLALINSYVETRSRSEVIRLMNGPPGTGKTTFLHRLVRWITREHVHKDVPRTSKNPYKLLVCAPTSQSLDVLLRKIWESIIKHTQDTGPGGPRERLKHIVDGVRIVRVGKAEEADLRLTPFLLSTVAKSMREQGSPDDQLSEDELYTKVLQQADIVGCTLEDCGSEIVRSSLEENVYALIVDDASHCLETEILLALQCRTKRVFMAGDQDQGIVNIRSKESRQLKYDRSMLQRLAENFEIHDKRIHQWEIQHRMKEEIALFPSKNFYSQRLKTPRKTKPFCLRPYIVFDVADGKESPTRGSVINTSEVAFISDLVSFISDLVSSFPKGKTVSLGIIAGSIGQKTKLLERLQGMRFPGLIGTPTDFYGLEKDVIILSCTCTSSKTPDGNGFVLNEELLNLVLTRAKFSLIIVGNMKNMQEMNSHWKSLVKDATDRQLVFKTLQGSYSTNVKKCLSEQTPNPGASSSRPEQPPSMYSASVRFLEGQPQRSEGNHCDRRNSGNATPANPNPNPIGRSEGNHCDRRNSGNATPANPSASSSRPEQCLSMSSASEGNPHFRYLDGQPGRSEGNHRDRRNSGNATPANPNPTGRSEGNHCDRRNSGNATPANPNPTGRSEGNHRDRRNSGNATPANPSASSSRPEQHPSMSSVTRSRPPPGYLEGQDRPTGRSKLDNYHNRYDPGPQGNPAYGKGHIPMEADAVMPSGVNSLPGDGGSGSRSSMALDRGNVPVDVREHHLPETPMGILRRQSSQTIQVLSNGVVQNSPTCMSRKRHMSGDAAIGNRGTARVRFEPETLYHERREKVPGLMNTVQYDSSSELHLGTNALSPSYSGPPSRGYAPTGSILKKPRQSIAATSSNSHQEEDFPTIDDPVQHDLRRQRTPVASTSTAPDRSTRKTSSTTHILRRNNHSNDSIRDTDNGKTFHSIATGMRDNQRISTRQKGKIIAGRNFGKRKCQRSRRKKSSEDHGRSPCGEVTNGGTSRSGDRAVEGQGHEQPQQQDQSHPRSRRQSRLPQPIPERQGQRMEALHQLATNPIHHDPNMLHNRNVNERFGGRSTALTEPQPNIRRRRRSNYVKDREMDFTD